MSVESGERGEGRIILAFELSALTEFEDPSAVFADAREWSRNVGVIANDAEAVEANVEKHGLRQDFDLGDRDKWLAASEIRAETNAGRYVFVGTTPEDRRLAEQVGWEFLRAEDAAEKAGWTLRRDTDGGTGIIGRLRAVLFDNSLRPFRRR